MEQETEVVARIEHALKRKLFREAIREYLGNNARFEIVNRLGMCDIATLYIESRLAGFSAVAEELFELGMTTHGILPANFDIFRESWDASVQVEAARN